MRTIEYIHEQPEWPRFRWRGDALTEPLAAVRHQQGRLLGRMEALGFPLRQEAALESLSADVVKSGEIEGERLDLRQVRSSVARKLGIEIAGLTPADRRVEGVVEMTLDATRHFDRPLTAKRMFGWHAALFAGAGGYAGLRRIRVGAWRDDASGPMQVVSGALGRERVHYEAPAAARLSREMRAFLRWFQAPPATDPVLKAALAHLWFVTVHPFDDGNGRIARVIADVALARSEGSSQRFYSMSAQILKQRSNYYAMLERTQRGTLDVTAWMEWFLDCLGRAIAMAETSLAGVLFKARFWESHASVPLHARQRAMLNRLLDGFEGALTTSKWAQLTQCSQDTAWRDMTFLVERGILARGDGGGRSTRYALAGKKR